MITALGPWRFRAYPTRFHDGDSLWLMCDTGFGGRAEPELRLSGVHAPELSQPGGKEATEFVTAWFARSTAPGLRWPFVVDVTMTAATEPNMELSFARYVATVWPANGPFTPETSLNVAITTFLSDHPEWPRGK